MARTRRSHRKKGRSVFSERQKDAILRIAYKPVETKKFINNFSWQTWLTDTEYTAPAVEHAGRQNILSQLQRATNTSQAIAGQDRFEGDEIQLRGLRFVINLTQSSTTPGAMYDVNFRFTVYTMQDYLVNRSEILTPFWDEVDEEGTTTPTWFKWNTRTTDIKYQRIFRMNNDGNLNTILSKKFWIPMNKKAVTEASDNPSSAFTETFGRMKGTNMYFALEMLAPGIDSFATRIFGNITWILYYKDG